MKLFLSYVLEQADLVVDGKREQLVLTDIVELQNGMNLLEDHPCDSVGEDSHLCAFEKYLEGLVSIGVVVVRLEKDECLEVRQKCLDLLRMHPGVRSDLILHVQQLILGSLLSHLFTHLRIAVYIYLAQRLRLSQDLLSHVHAILIETQLDLVEKNQDELRIHVEVGVDCLLEEVDVVQNVLDDLVLVLADVARHVALQQAVVGLDEVEQSPDKDDLVLPVGLRQSCLLLPFENLVDSAVFLSNLGKDASNTLLVVLDSLLHLLHIEVRVSNVLKQRSSVVLNLLQKFLSLTVREYLIYEVTSEVVGVAVLIEFVDDPHPLIDFLDVLRALVGGDLYLQIVLHNESAVIGEPDELLVEVVHDGLHDDDGEDGNHSDDAGDEADRQVDLVVELCGIGQRCRDVGVPAAKVQQTALLDEIVLDYQRTQNSGRTAVDSYSIIRAGRHGQDLSDDAAGDGVAGDRVASSLVDLDGTHVGGLRGSDEGDDDGVTGLEVVAVGEIYNLEQLLRQLAEVEPKTTHAVGFAIAQQNRAKRQRHLPIVTELQARCNLLILGQVLIDKGLVER